MTCIGETAMGRVGFRYCVEARSKFSGRDRLDPWDVSILSTLMGGGGEAFRFLELWADGIACVASLCAEPGRDDGLGRLATVGTAEETPLELQRLFGEQELKEVGKQ